MRTIDEGRSVKEEDETRSKMRSLQSKGDKRIFSEAGMFIDAIFARPHRRVVYIRDGGICLIC